MTSGTKLTSSDMWLIVNNTTGAYTVTVKLAGQGVDSATGTGVLIPQSTSNGGGVLVFSDGYTDVWMQNTQAIQGTTTNDNAQAGRLGEYVSSTIATGSSVSLTSGTTANITSISLTAGDWEVTGVVDYTFAATTSFTTLKFGISTTTATLGAQDTFGAFVAPASVPTAAADMAMGTPVIRLSLASTTTVYLVTSATFTVSTLKAYGSIIARRMR